MRLFIAEKPELARAIAEALDGAKNEFKLQGYIQKGNDIVTWAFGHLLELKKPDEFDEKYKFWNLEDLPISTGFEYRAFLGEENKFKKVQLSNILNLIKDSKITEIVHCGDADDEGQILIDEIIKYSKTQKPVSRVLINDLTKSAIQKELLNKKPNSAFKAMSDRGFARSFADYIVGLNLTRAYTCAFRKQTGQKELISVGRVQTPILALIVNRDYENENFKTKDYYDIKGEFVLKDKAILANLKLGDDEKIEDLERANQIKELCSGKMANFSFEKKENKQNPPLPYNLLSLQVECSKLYGFKPDKTLQITQSLREKHKAISYNRSDCEYLPDTIFEQRFEIIEALKTNFKENIGQDNVNLELKSKAFDSSKISAHYGIIPLNTKFDISKLSQEELIIYTLIAKRFLMQFYEAREYLSYTLNFAFNEFHFSKTLNKTTKMGFTAFFNNDNDKENEEEKLEWDIENLNLKESLIKDIKITKMQTKPKPKYTMTSLLKDLNQVAKYVKNERIKKLLLEKDKDKKGEKGGIGTPATRSEMIAKLIRQEYIEVSKDKKQNITSTTKGRELIKNCSTILKTMDMTALWFEYQKEIEEGRRSLDNFINFVKSEVEMEIDSIKEGNFTMQNGAKAQARIDCPNCAFNGFLIKRKGKFGNFWGCSEYQKGCKNIFKDKNNKPDFEKESKKAASELTNMTCPQCKKGTLIKRESQNKKGQFWLGCSEFKNGCKFTKIVD